MVFLLVSMMILLGACGDKKSGGKKVSEEDFLGTWQCNTTFESDFAENKAGDKQVLTIKIVKGGTGSQEVANGEGKVLSSGSFEWEYIDDSAIKVTSMGTANTYELQSDGTLKRLNDDKIYNRK